MNSKPNLDQNPLSPTLSYCSVDQVNFPTKIDRSNFDNCAHLKYLVITSISNFDQFLSHLFGLDHRINTVKQWPLCEDIGLMCRMSGSVLH